MGIQKPPGIEMRKLVSIQGKLPINITDTSPTYHDFVTTQLWGVLHSGYSVEQITSLLYDFLTDTEEMPLRSETYDRYKKIYYGKLGAADGGHAAEYFFLDGLMRNGYQGSKFELTHRKGPHFLDHKVKVDFLTRIKYTNNSVDHTHRIGTQFYYKKVKATYPNFSESVSAKENQVYEGICNQILTPEVLPLEFTPEIPCLVVVNSEYLQKNDDNKDNKTIFLSAMNTRSKNGYAPSGPVACLPSRYAENMHHMIYFYQKACRSFVRFLHDLGAGNRPHEKFSTTSIQDAALRKNTYDPKKKRATYDFYYLTGDKRIFLSIIFRITPDMEKKFFHTNGEE